MAQTISIQRIYYTLRFASAMCFIGHGAFGIITKKIWLNYFAVFGIGPAMGYHLMPWLGTVDILIGLSLLFYPTRVFLLWLVIWGTITALLRPLSGEPFAKTIERAGNYGAPLTLLILYGLGGRPIKDWFQSIKATTPVTKHKLATTAMALRMIMFLLLAGHGWLNLLGKKGLLDQYASLGFAYPARVALIAGIFEIAAAFLILVKPLRPFLIIILVWKMGTELFYPHWKVFEWVERGGSYGVILALWFLLGEHSVRSIKTKFTTGTAFVGIAVAFLIGLYYTLPHKALQKNAVLPMDQAALKQVVLLDKKIRNSTFVFVNQIPETTRLSNRVIHLPPVGDELRIDFDKYVHRGHFGPLYVVLPDNYAGPKEKFILKSFSDYKGWYGSMLTDKVVMYAAQ